MMIYSDTGVLLRLFEPNDPLHPVIHQAVDLLDTRGVDHITGTQNIGEFWNVCTRPATARGGLGLSLRQTDSRLQRVERKFSILAELQTTYRTWRRLVVTHCVMGKQVHDARIVATMMSHGISHILTLNVADFQRYPGITVIDPRLLVLVP
jgi:predicted nucleic acid-binding protein